MQDAVHAVTDAKLILRRLEVNIRCPILVRLPDDLIDELDHTGVLVALGDLLVGVKEDVERIVLVILQFLECLGADAVIFLQRLLDLAACREGQLDRAARVVLHGVDHRRVERITDCHFERAVLGIDRQNKMLERHLGGDPLASLVGGVQFRRLDKSQFHRFSQTLEERLLCQPLFTGKKAQQRLFGAVFGRRPPFLRPLLKFPRRSQVGVGQNLFYRCQCHSACRR